MPGWLHPPAPPASALAAFQMFNPHEPLGLDIGITKKMRYPLVKSTSKPSQAAKMGVRSGWMLVAERPHAMAAAEPVSAYSLPPFCHLWPLRF